LKGVPDSCVRLQRTASPHVKKHFSTVNQAVHVLAPSSSRSAFFASETLWNLWDRPCHVPEIGGRNFIKEFGTSNAQRANAIEVKFSFHLYVVLYGPHVRTTGSEHPHQTSPGTNSQVWPPAQFTPIAQVTPRIE